VSAFPQGLQELGYVEGQNIEILYRYAEGNLTRLPALADELVQLHPDVIVTAGSAIPEIKRSTATIPIVGVAMTDPVGFGFAASIARPAGQVTGIIRRTPLAAVLRFYSRRSASIGDSFDARRAG
jgi:putative ABC transport system substrate-binding protein